MNGEVGSLALIGGIAAGLVGTYAGMRAAGMRPSIKATAIVWGVGGLVAAVATFAIAAAVTP